jgi:hypothetical protein
MIIDKTSKKKASEFRRTLTELEAFIWDFYKTHGDRAISHPDAPSHSSMRTKRAKNICFNLKQIRGILASLEACPTQLDAFEDD